MILENWGHDDLKRIYIDEKKVAVEIGLSGNKGVIGWYVPPWMVEQYPDITDWRNLDQHAHLFRTPSSGTKGQLLDGDPTYVTNDEALVRNLKLNFTVVYAGSEAALIKAFRDAERDHTPLLGYFYSPQWLLSEIPLVHIALPAVHAGLRRRPAARSRATTSPTTSTRSLTRPSPTPAAPRSTLIKNFQWTNADQNQVARDITVNKLSLDQAGKKWLDAHRATWQEWLRSD